MSDESAPGASRAPLATLERALIDQFLRQRGCDPDKLAERPQPDRESLLKEASLYASAKLTEIESRSQLLDDLHAGIPPGEPA